MADQQIAYRIFRDRALKAPSAPLPGGTTLGSTDVPATFGRVTSTSSVMPPRPVLYAGRAMPLNQPTEPLELANYAVYDPQNNGIFETADVYLSVLAGVDLTVAGLGTAWPNFVLVPHHGLFVVPEGRLTATLPAPAAPEKLFTSFTAVNDYALTDQPSLGKQIWQLMTSSELPYAQDLARRICQIQERLEEDEDEKIRISGNSVRHLVQFLEENHIRRPQLAPTPSGYLMARWVIQGRKITIHFYRDGRAEYYVSAPNPLHPEKQDLDSSITTADALPTKLGQLGVLAWINH